MANSGTFQRIMVFIVNFGVRFFRFGITKSYGLLIPYLAYQLDASNAVTGFLVTLHSASGCLISPLANYLIQRYNYRLVLILTICLSSIALLGTAFFLTEWALVFCMSVSGVCLSPLLQLMVIALRQQFGDQFGSAFSASYTGAVFGTLLMPLVAMWSYQAYGLRGALLCLNALGLNMIPLGLLVSLESFSGNVMDSRNKPSPMGRGQESVPKQKGTTPSTSYLQESDESSESSPTCSLLPPPGSTTAQPDINGEARLGTATETTDIEDTDIPDNDKNKEIALRGWAYITSNILDFMRVMFMYDTFRNETAFSLVVLPCRFFFDTVYLGWIVFMVSYALSVGTNSTQAVYLPMSAAVGGFCGRVGQVLLLHYRPKMSSISFVVSIVLSSGAIYGHTFNFALWNLIVCSCVAGFGLFGAASVYYSMMADLVDEENFKGALAASLFVNGIGILLSGFSVGLVFDLTQSFVFTYRILAATLAIISVTMTVFLMARRRGPSQQ